ncbi:MAG: hypothetical protein K9M97_07935 [Akkermansiaceae bacterium]|nr:hypothetical protein [Akkermansiaceae bacterium]
MRAINATSSESSSPGNGVDSVSMIKATGGASDAAPDMTPCKPEILAEVAVARWLRRKFRSSRQQVFVIQSEQKGGRDGEKQPGHGTGLAQCREM